jgi:hypothetical protein
MERFFAGVNKSPDRAGNSEVFNHVVLAEDRFDFHRLIVSVSVAAYHRNLEWMENSDKTTQKMLNGDLLKIPSGIPSYCRQLELASELRENEIVTIHGHGDLSENEVNTLIFDKQGNPCDITIPPEVTADKMEEMSAEISRQISEQILKAAIPGNETVTKERMTRMIYYYGHTQCGALQLDFENVLQRFILDSNKAIRDENRNASKLMYFIDLRKDKAIAAIKHPEENGSMHLKLRLFNDNDLNNYLSQKKLKVAKETQCVDDNFPYISALNSGLAEKSFQFNTTSNPFLAQRERTREDSYVHNVGLIFVGTLGDSKFASFLQNGTQVLRNMSPRMRVNSDEKLANASGSLIYLMKDDWLEDYIGGISGINELVGPGHNSSKMRLSSGIRFAANPLYDGRYPQIRGVSIGWGQDLGNATLVRTTSDEFKDIPRGPAVLLSQTAVNALGGWDKSLLKLCVGEYFYSTVMCIDPERDAANCILDYYNNTNSDLKPISSIGWRNLSD